MARVSTPAAQCSAVEVQCSAVENWGAPSGLKLRDPTPCLCCLSSHMARPVATSHTTTCMRKRGSLAQQGQVMGPQQERRPAAATTPPPLPTNTLPFLPPFQLSAVKLTQIPSSLLNGNTNGWQTPRPPQPRRTALCCSPLSAAVTEAGRQAATTIRPSPAPPRPRCTFPCHTRPPVGLPPPARPQLGRQAGRLLRLPPLCCPPGSVPH